MGPTEEAEEQEGRRRTECLKKIRTAIERYGEIMGGAHPIFKHCCGEEQIIHNSFWRKLAFDELAKGSGNIKRLLDFRWLPRTCA